MDTLSRSYYDAFCGALVAAMYFFRARHNPFGSPDLVSLAASEPSLRANVYSKPVKTPPICKAEPVGSTC